MTKAFLTSAWLLVVLSSSLLASELESQFRDPPDSARPGVYWYFMDGNQDRDEMIADLHAMKDVGIGTVLFLEVDLGLPRGPVSFMSDQWLDNVAHAFVEAGELGMEVILGTGPGWAGSGGSWVSVEDSMKHLVGKPVRVTGPAVLDRVLDVPPPHPPSHYSGMNETHQFQRNAWHEDVAVLAYPTPESTLATIDQAEIKTLRDVTPYSKRVPDQLMITPQAIYAEPDASRIVDPAKVIDLTPLMQPDGRIRWDVPAGDWTVMRFVSRSTGQTTRPAPQTGHGFETNKLDGETYRRHWDQFQAKLLDKITANGGNVEPGKGLTTIHLDSWEMSSQNWTRGFREEFQRRRGYDPQPFYPASIGVVVGSLEQTERFLWDLRKTTQELVLQQYAGEIKKVAHEHGLLYSNEPYDMNPAGDIDLGSVADIPFCEFWNAPRDRQYSCLAATSIAHTTGPQMVKAEAFTSNADAFAKHPANMKNQSDWAFAIGITDFVFHTFQHQALGNRKQPGMAMGRYGIQWHRNQTFWNFLPAYHKYLARCSHLSRQGEVVADILYLTPEGVPYTFIPPEDAVEGTGVTHDKKGYSFDAVTPRILAERAVVEDGRIAFPGGSKYRVLVLPDLPTMTPPTLRKIRQLVQDGATIIGNPPQKSPSLVDYPACDQMVTNVASETWSDEKVPASLTQVTLGKGQLFWGKDLNPEDGIFPSYRVAAKVLSQLGLAEDFSSPSGKLRFIHRETETADIYFVANRTDERVVTEGNFRITGRQPQLWDPVTGDTKLLSEFESLAKVTRVPMTFAPFQSFFVVFPKDAADIDPKLVVKTNFPTFGTAAQIDGPWEVAFDPEGGGPSNVVFDELEDWTRSQQDGIRYYSGIATYRKAFDFPLANNQESDASNTAKFVLDFGKVHDLCRVRLNGHDLGILWTAPWHIDVSSFLQDRGNELEIDVVNAWANRLIGDEQPGNKHVRKVSWPSGLLGGREFPAGRFTFVTHDHYKANSALKPAGLIGPVLIRKQLDQTQR